MKQININIHQFTKEFQKIYEWLYNYGNRTEISEAAKKFDERISMNENFKNFVCEFVRFRGDIISSDREAAAFMGALWNLQSV